MTSRMCSKGPSRIGEVLEYMGDDDKIRATTPRRDSKLGMRSTAGSDLTLGGVADHSSGNWEHPGKN